MWRTLEPSSILVSMSRVVVSKGRGADLSASWIRNRLFAIALARSSSPAAFAVSLPRRPGSGSTALCSTRRGSRSYAEHIEGKSSDRNGHPKIHLGHRPPINSSHISQRWEFPTISSPSWIRRRLVVCEYSLRPNYRSCVWQPRYRTRGRWFTSSYQHSRLRASRGHITRIKCGQAAARAAIVNAHHRHPMAAMITRTVTAGSVGSGERYFRFRSK